MTAGKRICKVCGKEYKYCATERSDSSVFRYQDVCCSPEHGAQYFAEVMAARAESAGSTANGDDSVKITKSTTVAPKKTSKKFKSIVVPD